ncbi:MAG TPA: YfhO family protein, partial [Planctomycetaceae bacterium]|nr:YfhO family protein [Planctomycetaceae bacterium]
RIPPAPETRDENGFIEHDAQFSERLRQTGVTHLLTQQPLSSGWPCQLVLKEPDPFLNAAWGRRPSDPLYLYELSDPRGRVFWKPASQSVAEAVEQETTIEWIEREPERHVLKVEVPESGQLVVTELLFPGWQVNVDGEPATPVRVEGMFRGVELSPGEHTVVWQYRPDSFRWGIGLSLGMLCLLALIAHIRFWHPGRLNWLEDR